MENYLNILNKLKSKSQKSLSDDNLIWICSLIEKYKPKRLLEIGASVGGSTSVYLNCLQNLNIGCELVSVDCETYALYKEGRPLIGSEVYELKDYLDLDNYRLITGKYIPEIVDDIGKFDMIIMDTVHFIPGEVLDMLCLKNNIDKNTVIILDDINIESRYPDIYEENLKSSSSNGMILTALKGDLLFPENSFPEIGGIVLSDGKIDEERLLLCLCHKWNSDILESKNKYFEKIKELYGEEYLVRLEAVYEKYKFSNFTNDEKVKSLTLN